MRMGLGDWFEPNCDTPGSVPGQAACGVPHWYCYVPGMATPDCLASLSEGLTEIGSDLGGAAAGVPDAAGKGLAAFLEGLFKGSGTGTLLLIALGVGAFIVLNEGKKRR